MSQITVKEKPESASTIIKILSPTVKDWFFSRFKEFSLPQLFGVYDIHCRQNILVSAPTGATKTLTGFLSILNELVDLADKKQLEDRVYAVYISPLKALNYDIQHNLKNPLKEIEKLAGKRLGIRVGVRTGDTSPKERAKMMKTPPHILITTPESLAILLQSVNFRKHLSNVEWGIIDEIHALAENKRGVHLSLTMEMLQRISPGMCRVGLSATIAPLEDVANFLVGSGRDCRIVDVQFIKQLDMKVLSPVPDLIDTTHEGMHNRMYGLINELVQQHKTTLIFTNTRSATERIVHYMKERFPKNYTDVLSTADDEDFKAELSTNGNGHVDIHNGNGTATTATMRAHSTEEESPSTGVAPSGEAGHAETRELGEPGVVAVPNILNEREYEKVTAIGAHHGSLSKTHRHRIEEGLRQGKLKCVVCSTSLELGIDIGYIDLVILLGSPKSVARALQRVGRSGHQLHATTKGRIIVLDRDDLVECSVLLKSAVDKKIDRIHIPRNCLDVLAQQIYGICISEKLHVSDLLAMVKQSYCYRDLESEEFYSVIRYLSGEHVSLEDRHVYAKIWYDPETGMVGRKGKLARVLYMTNIGTIPDETGVTVKVGTEVIGMIDEAFLERLKRGDVFVLGGSTYEFQFSRGTVAQVRAATGRKPTVPSWFSEMLPLSFDLAQEVGRFRRLMRERFDAKMSRKDILSFINSYLYVDDNAANAIYEYMREQHDFALIPTDKEIVIEHYFDDEKKYAVFHTIFGRRVNDCLSRAVAFVISKTQKKDVEIGVTDNGFYLAAKKNLPAARALSMLESERLGELLNIAIDKTQVLSRRFRHCAGRSLMILRSYKGRQKKVGRQQVSSMILMSAVKRISKDFPVLKEARREVLEDLMDIENATRVVRMIENHSIAVKGIDTMIPSPFAFNLVLQGHLDMIRMEDRIEFLKRMHKLVLAKISLDQGKSGGVDEDTKQVYEDLWKGIEVDTEHDSTKQRLIKQAWNLKRVPMFAKKEIVRMLDGERTGIRPDVLKALHTYSKEIEKTWPRDLRLAVFAAVGEIEAEEGA
ncbi:DEAD/DEAH box helicase [Candidatus Woesearchaeota archaeon]|nr:DEAD/DEAH box helicase [Candidatus Woesearchaeota archaeon]